MAELLIFGPGYVAARFAAACAAMNMRVSIVRRQGSDEAIGIDEQGSVRAAIGRATHILSSVPPEGDADPVLARHAGALSTAPARWIGYLSSTGVYGDSGGAWVDEGAPIGGGRRSARTRADLHWQALHPAVRVFRLPGIYGPGRSPLDRVRSGSAHRIDRPGQIFSRVHVDDIVAGLIASFTSGPAGVFNLADDLPAGQNLVIEEASRLLGLPPPPFVPLDTLSPAARAFYAENRRVANGKAKRLLGWSPTYSDYRAGLAALAAADWSP